MVVPSGPVRGIRSTRTRTGCRQLEQRGAASPTVRSPTNHCIDVTPEARAAWKKPRSACAGSRRVGDVRVVQARKDGRPAEIPPDRARTSERGDVCGAADRRDPIARMASASAQGLTGIGREDAGIQQNQIGGGAAHAC